MKWKGSGFATYRYRRFLTCWMILSLGAGTATGGSGKKTNAEADSWKVRLLYQDQEGEGKREWRTKKKLTALVNPGAVLLKEDEKEFLQISTARIRTVFYDEALQKKLLTDLTEPPSPALKKPGRGAAGDAQIALGVTAIGWGVGIPVAMSTVGLPVAALGPAAVFPPALIAVGGIVAIQALKDDPRHFVHVIWEEEGTLHAAAIGVKKKDRHSLLSALENSIGLECLNLPEEREKLQAEIREQKPNKYELVVREEVSFGSLVLKKNDETYKLVLLEREDSPGELYFFCPSISMKSLVGVVLVDVVDDDPPGSSSRKSRHRRFAPVKYGAVDGPRSIEEFQMHGNRIRPAAIGNAQGAADRETP